MLTEEVDALTPEAIRSGVRPGGSRLKVRDLAAQVGTSVLPVREAIRRLEEAGLAERSLTVRCLVAEDGSVPDDEDAPGNLAVVARAY